MKRTSSLKRRVCQIERARGSLGFTLQFQDGSSQHFHLDSQIDEMKILFSAVAIANAANVPDAPPPNDDRFARIARLVGTSEGSSDEGLYGTVRELVRGARNCTSHAPDVASS